MAGKTDVDASHKNIFDTTFNRKTKDKLVLFCRLILFCRQKRYTNTSAWQNLWEESTFTSRYVTLHQASIDVTLMAHQFRSR